MVNLNAHRKTLLVLSKAKPKAARKILEGADPSLITALSEISLNVLNGLIPLTDARKRRMCKYKKDLRKMATRAGTDQKRKALSRGGFLSSLLTFTLPFLFKGVSKLVSHIKKKRAEKKRRSKSD